MMNRKHESRWTGPELKLIHDGEAPPIELPMSFFVKKEGGFVYKNLDVMANRQYTAPSNRSIQDSQRCCVLARKKKRICFPKASVCILVVQGLIEHSECIE
jgi:hypothetical protein